MTTVTFDELNLSTPLLNALNDAGYENPTPIQVKVFPVIMSGRDVVGIAQTGTGKTLSYLLPLLRMLPFSEQRHPRVLIVVPTRELVIQVVKELDMLTKYMTIRKLGVYGGTNIVTQKQKVYNGVDVLVATPGRLVDLSLSGILRLQSIQKLVIDEVDEMLNLGFRTQLINLIDALPPRRQNLMFSATLSEDVSNLINTFFSEPERIEVAPHGTPLEQIIQRAYHVPNFYTKINFLEYLLNRDEEMTKALVFVESKKMADKVYDHLVKSYPDIIGVIHSNRSQNQRFSAVRHLEEGSIRVLIATDIVARGLDISGVTHVINFDTPDVPGDYIHRIGRTGRADKVGIAITLINEVEQPYQAAIEKMMKKKIPLLPLPEDLTISQVYTEEERPKLFDKNYVKNPKRSALSSAFHEKKDKNKKINLGGPGRRNPKFGKKNTNPELDAPKYNRKIKF
ncbi:DEAD/DEAH box helicase [Williamwhitmania taraxaci]|uniref:ATP-dependent RNA helicase RhlE n=1 Tax=Williamwhitmania taraxaci TaxID=1640674 RepID=A0A1G6IGW9_9BACT|nr:DEAD/DEAH box helicase [Williamwhitmania taraxaci]SDC05728.1 ATP-dependent RNA helicase RhlE [Williamwhitmania taraxaci]